MKLLLIEVKQMISTTDLYSLNGDIPKVLPNRIKFSDGKTKTDILTFTENDILRSGFEGPYNIPDYDPDRYIPKWNEETKTWDMTDHPVWLGNNFVQPIEQQTEQVREYRNYLLSLSDWTRLDDNSLTEEQKESWENYRKELRNVPQQDSFDGTIDSAIWPTKPE
jgi:hypothetical protein